MADRFLSLVVALGLAILVWLYARSRDQEVLDNVPIPVEITLAQGQVDQYDLAINGPLQVPVSFRGPPSRLRELRNMLQSGGVRVAVTVAVPADRQNESRYVETMRIDAADVHAPAGVTPLVVEGRNHIPVTLHRIVERRLPVRLEPAPDERVSQVILEPARVRVRGPQDILDRARAIPTEPFLVPPVNETAAGQEMEHKGTICLVQEMGGRPVRCFPAAVSVQLKIGPRQKLYEVADVPVHFLCPPNFALRPRFLDERCSKISVRVWGPLADEPPHIVAFVDLTGRNLEPGLYADEPLRLQLPQETQLAQSPPRSAMFQLGPLSDPSPKNHKAVPSP
jgi:hypothetical protein